MLRSLPPQAGLIGFTNTPGSPLASRAEALLLTHAGSENMVSCKTYVAALVALVVLEALLTGRDPLTNSPRWTEKPAWGGGRIPCRAAGYTGKHGAAAARRSVSGAGRAGELSLAAAGTGGLIIKEAAHFPAEGMSCAAFRHGPLNMVSRQNFLLVYAGLEPTRALNRNLVRDIQASGGNAALVEIDPVRDAFHLPVVPVISLGGLAILEILPAQKLLAALARLHGHIPG